MMTIIKSPITIYANGVVINQTGHTKELFDYYWTSYSRGTDGTSSDPLFNNTYLDGYSTLRTKSIYDPCPYSYRTPTNGTYNQFPKTFPIWALYSYIGGAKFTLSTNSTWLSGTGRRDASTGLFINVGHAIGYRTATTYAATSGYVLQFNYNNLVYTNTDWARAWGTVIRCIETIKSPITFYGNNTVIDQAGHTQELFDYYWSSYSRGTDGTQDDSLFSNTYIDGYNTLRAKSIYDPCPYSYKLPTNGTYNQFSISYPAWTLYSYTGGAKFTFPTNSTWFPVTGFRYADTGMFIYVGHYVGYYTATAFAANVGYLLNLDCSNMVFSNTGWGRATGLSIRCMEECGIF